MITLASTQKTEENTQDHTRNHANGKTEEHTKAEEKKKIEDKDAELIELESNFYKRVSAKSVELEGIGKEEEAEIERHRHLFEMQ